MKSHELLAASESERLALINSISAKRKSRVISYLTSTRPGLPGFVSRGDIEIIEKHVRQAHADGAENIDLILTTYGGHTVAPWDFIAMLRDYLPKGRFGVILPGMAYSAGTMIALGADEIIAGPTTRLGPVDSTSGWESFFWDDGRSSTSALKGFMQLVESTGIKERHAQDLMIDWLTRQTDALALGETYRSMRENRRLIENIIGSRVSPPPASVREKVINFLLYEVGDHSQAIRRREAAKEGIDTLTDMETSGLETDVIRLFNLYADIMKLNSPFARLIIDSGRPGDLTDYDAYGEHASETPIILVESAYDTNAAYMSYGIRHWDETPPVIPPLPDGGPPKREGPTAQDFSFRWQGRHTRADQRPSRLKDPS